MLTDQSQDKHSSRSLNSPDKTSSSKNQILTMSKTKKTILITGCSDGGLGSALALEFHKVGWRVFATARNVSKLKNTEAAGIESIALDVLSAESIKACVAELEKLTGGSLDALLNNAGGGYSMPILDIEIPKLRDLFELNVYSVVSVTQAFIPLLLKSTQGAMVINNTSIVSVMTIPVQGAYNASKAAAAALSGALRVELEPLGIKVIDLKTGAIKSNFFENISATKLPPQSYYISAKESIETFMNGAELQKGAADQTVWAKQVVGDLTKSRPPLEVWRGGSTFLAWVFTWLPAGFTDGEMKKMTGLVNLKK
jgi:1-acylglycerone phosphate reductase